MTKINRRTGLGAVIFVLVLFGLFCWVGDGEAFVALSEPGRISFAATNYSVGEGGGHALVTLRREGETNNRVVTKVSITDVTTSPDDYYKPGDLDTSFDPGSNSEMVLRTAAIQPDGKIIIGGFFTTYNGVARNHIARLDADGSLDTTFVPSPDISSGVLRTALQSDGKIIICGGLISYNGVERNSVARLNADGSLDTSFDPGLGVSIEAGVLRAVALQQDGKIIIGGQFDSYNGVKRNNIARLNADGSLDTSFNPDLGVHNVVFAAAIQPDGKIIIVGADSTALSATASYIARLNIDGSFDTSFAPGSILNGSVTTAAVQPDGKIIIGGGFRSYNGVECNGVARLNIDGSLDTSFDPGSGVRGAVVTARIQPDGKIIIGGAFSSYNGVERSCVARLNADGSLDTTFTPTPGANATVNTAVFQPDGKIVIGGRFNTYNGVGNSRIARVLGDLFVTWEAGDSADKTISIPIVDDALSEEDETLSLTLTPVTSEATPGLIPQATLTIVDNEVHTPTSIAAVSGGGAYGGSATLNATLTSSSVPLANQIVAFTLNGNPVGSALTDANGVATLGGISLSSIDAGYYPSAVVASFAGATYTGSSGTGALTVTKADQAITWADPAGITYGTPLSATQLNATVAVVGASPAGAVTYSPAMGTVLGAGGGQPLTVNVAGTNNYNPATQTVHIDVVKATPTFSDLSSLTIDMGATPTALSGRLVAGNLTLPPAEQVSITLNGVTQSVAVGTGSFTLSFATGALVVGSYPVTFLYPGNDNFNPAAGTSMLQVAYRAVALYDQTKTNKSGSTVSIKVQVINASGVNVSSAALVVHAFQVRQTLGTPYGEPANAGNANPDLNFRYDSSLGGYIFNLKTTDYPTGIYLLAFTVGADPTVHTVQFQVR